MGRDPKKLTPNHRLRQQRQLRSWTLEDVARKLYHLCEGDRRANARGEINAKMIGSWERGEHVPHPYYQEKLRILFGQTAEELGFVEPVPLPKPLPFISSSNMSQVSPAGLTPHQAIDVLGEHLDVPADKQLGAWLVLSVHHLAPLFEAGWTRDEVLEAVHILLKGVHVISSTSHQKFSRRQLLHLGVSTLLSSIAVPLGEHVSVEERLQLHQALGESIAAGWKLFHTAGNAQILAIGQAQLYLVQQQHSLLYPGVQPIFYSAVYRLIGAALHFQGRYEEAYRTQEKAYISALEGADAWNMAQSRSWQAYGLQACGKYPEALQAADAALRLVSYQQDTESIRLRARLLAFSAENAALMRDAREVQRRLSASEALLDHLPGYHEEFDRVSWLQQAGACALSLEQYEIAAARLRQALDELPAQWTLRAVSTAVPLATAVTRMHELDEALAIARKTLPLVKSSASPTLIQAFATYLQTELLASFPNDRRCQTFVAKAQQQLTLA